MTKVILKSFCALALLSLHAVGADEKPKAEAASAFKDEKDRISYSIGMNIGSNFKKQGVEVNPEVLAAGIRDSLVGDKTRLTEKEMMETLNTYQTQMMTKKAEKAKIQGEKNRTEGVTFLEANKKKEGVKTLESGLQYKSIKEGTGPVPKSTDTVKTHYRGTLIDGTEFDSSYKRGEPATFPVTGVIKGWTEALQLMKVGSKWQLFIPSALAYAEKGAGADIGPDAVLVFEIELLEIVKQ